VANGAGVYNSAAQLAGKASLPPSVGMLGALPSAANFAGTIIDGKPRSEVKLPKEFSLYFSFCLASFFSCSKLLRE
jgi:hypothetical protein